MNNFEPDRDQLEIFIQGLGGRWLETRRTRDAVVPVCDDDREMRDGWRCIPVPPTLEGDWFIIDDSNDWKTVWGRWRKEGTP